MKKQHWQQIQENHQSALLEAINLFYQYGYGANGPPPSELLAKRLKRKIKQEGYSPLNPHNKVV